MSRYCTVKTEFMDRDSLVKALMETGNWSLDQIEVHDVAQHLIGYNGDTRRETANVIVRRANIGDYSNDLGFVLNDKGLFEAVISEFDSRKFNQQWVGKLTGNYAFNVLDKELTAYGRTVTRTKCEETGRQRVEITGYR